MSRISKKDKRALTSTGLIKNSELNPDKFNVDPNIRMKTDGQADAFDAWLEGYNLVMYGYAGTGKTFLALYFAIHEMMKRYEEDLNIVIVRSTVQSREIGFLSGNAKEKVKEFEEIYKPMMADVTDVHDAYNILLKMDRLEFAVTSFLRGRTWNNAIIIVDEAQNMTDSELNTVITRVGTNSRVIICGDLRQNDLENQRKKETTGFGNMISIADLMDCFDLIEFQKDDIVRSNFVKDYIDARERIGL